MWCASHKILSLPIAYQSTYAGGTPTSQHLCRILVLQLPSIMRRTQTPSSRSRMPGSHSVGETTPRAARHPAQHFMQDQYLGNSRYPSGRNKNSTLRPSNLRW